MSKKSENPASTKSTATSTPAATSSARSIRRVLKFALVGGTLALFNFAVYEFIARVILNNNELLWLDSIISYLLATILAYFCHSRVTWKERTITRHGIAMFFLWNGLTAVLISPLFTWLFTQLTPVYEFAHSISANLSLPFDYAFVESTGIFCFTTCITMILNYLFYDKLVFDDTYFQKLISRLHKPTKEQLFSLLLYLLPVIFALTTMFLITTSGEDNFQGAGNLANGASIDVVQDAVNAFNFNSRITDMYAWSVIDFYDYQFQFGVDTIFRLIDVALFIGVFYLATYLVLARRPRLTVRDALVFCALFSFYIITPFGRAFYHEFSMIHNYIPLALATLLITIPYLNFATGHAPKKHPRILALGLLLLGVYFGMAATITPIAFLATVIIYCLVYRKSLSRPPLWFFAGLIGTITGFLICWLAGSGVDHYTNPITAATFDYLPPSDIFTHFDKLIFHEVYNFGLVLLPLLVIALLCFIFSKDRQKLLKKRHLSPYKVKLCLIFGFFTIIHILGASLVKAPPRLLIPAYLAGLILIFRLFAPHLCYGKFLTSVLVFFTTLIILTHAVLLVKYHHEMSLVLADIKSSPEEIICLSPEATKPSRIPLLDLAQANILVDWGMPEPILGKGVSSCE